MNMEKNSPIQALIDLLFDRLKLPEVDASECSRLIKIAMELNEKISSKDLRPKNSWMEKGSEDLSKFIDVANYKAQKIANKTLDKDDIDSQIKKILNR